MSVRGLYPPPYPLDLEDIQRAIDGTLLHQVIYEVYRPKRDAFILETGCGTGKLGIFYAVRGCNVTLVDIDPHQINRSIKLLRAVEEVLGTRLAVGYRVGDAKALPYLDNTFSLVYSEGVVEHFVGEERQKYLKEMVRVSRECVAVVAPSSESEGSMRRSRETLEKFPAMEDKEHPIASEEMQSDLSAAGLQNIVVKRFDMMRDIGFVIGAGMK